MITSVKLAKESSDAIGLQEVEMHDLGRVVILAGPNGGGKSRLLKQVETLGHSLDGTQLTWSPQRIIRPRMLDAATVNLAVGMIHSPFEQPSEFRSIAERRSDRLTEFARMLFNAAHPQFTTDEKVAQAGALAQRFSAICEALLGTKLDVGIDDTHPVPKLFDRPFADQELSAGQRLLLAWSLLLHDANESTVDGQVLLLDEPERHLHPRAAVDILDRLATALGESGQLWVATHSPAIVAHYGRQSVYLVENNRVTYAGSRIDRVMDGLLGEGDGRRTLLDFLAEADDLSFHRYAVEALFAPAVAPHADGDPQEQLFSRAVSRALAGGEKSVRLLDYGAGRGRFAVALAGALPTELRRRVEYFAYNHPEHDEHHAECLGNVARLHPDIAEQRLVARLSDCWQEPFDVVVMTNFLHEVDPREWRAHFKDAAEVLQPDGRLWILEDQEPSVGELPYREGLIVLDLDETRELFGRSPAVQSLSQGSRLTAFEVPASVLRAYDPSHLRATLMRTADRCRKQLAKLRQDLSGTPQSRGRRHAFFSILFTSAQLLLEQLPGAPVAE